MNRKGTLVISDTMIMAFGILVSFAIMATLGSMIFSNQAEEADVNVLTIIAKDIAAHIDTVAGEAGSVAVVYEMPKGINADVGIDYKRISISADNQNVTAQFLAMTHTDEYDITTPSVLCIVKNQDDMMISVSKDRCVCNVGNGRCDPACLLESECDTDCYRDNVRDNVCDARCLVDGDGICDPDCDKEADSDCMPASSVDETENVFVHFFIMSECPYGIRAIQNFMPVMEEFKEVIDFRLDFVGWVNDTTGLPGSKHGESEVLGDKIEICAQKYEPDTFLYMIDCVYETTSSVPGNWEGCANEYGMDVDTIETCAYGDEGTEMLLDSIRNTEARSIVRSPTMFFNGEEYIISVVRDDNFRDNFMNMLRTEYLRAQMCRHIPNDQRCNTGADDANGQGDSEGQDGESDSQDGSDSEDDTEGQDGESDSQDGSDSEDDAEGQDGDADSQDDSGDSQSDSESSDSDSSSDSENDDNSNTDQNDDIGDNTVDVEEDPVVDEGNMVTVSTTGNGDFNCEGSTCEDEINDAIEFVKANSGYTTVHLNGPGTFWIDGSIYLKNNMILEGDSDAVVELVANANWDNMYNGLVDVDETIDGTRGITNVVIRGFKIDGNRPNQAQNIGLGYYNTIKLRRAYNVQVYDMYLTNNLGDGVMVDHGSVNTNPVNIFIHDNTIYEVGHDAVYLKRMSNALVYNNRITCNVNSGVRIYNTNHVKIYNNVIRSYGNGGSAVQVEAEDGTLMDDIEIYNNIIHETQLWGILIRGYRGTTPQTSKDIYIHHNLIFGTGTSYGDQREGGISIYGFHNTIIESNTLDYNRKAGIIMGSDDHTDDEVTVGGFVTIVRNNIITNSVDYNYGSEQYGYGIMNDATSTHSYVIYNNCIYGNDGGSYKNVNAGTNDINADPLYASETWSIHDESSTYSDYHLKSTYGRWNGNSWVTDSVNSPCIDAGYASADYSNEPEDNGDRINLGVYGNTHEASKSG